MDTLPFFFYYITKLEKRNVFLSNYYRMKTVKPLHKRRILFESHLFSGKIVHGTVKLNDKHQKKEMAMKLDGLEILHQNMKENNLERVTFDFRKNGKLFKVIFLADIDPYKLLIGVRSELFCLSVSVSTDYDIKPSIDRDHYKALVEILGLQYDPNNPFKPKYFFEELNIQIPERVNVNSRVAIHEIAELNRPAYEDGEKIYFKGWKDNNIKGEKVQNLQKTRECLGEEAYLICKEHNISSVWTKHKAESKEFYLYKV